MKLQNCALACCLSLVAAGGGNTLRRQVVTHLRTDEVPTAAIVESTLRASLALFGQQPDSFSNSGLQDAAAAPKKGKQPTHMQVPEEEMDEFMAKLSSSCRKQYKDILNGEGAAIHTFGSPQVNASGTECKKLEGKLCFTRALVQQQKKHTDRNMKSFVDVSGNSCLPDQCTQTDDLTALAEFMRGKAKEQVPGMETKIGLHVDCSNSGGAMVDIGDSTDAMGVARDMNRTSGKAGSSGNPLQDLTGGHPNSGAAPLSATAVAVLFPALLLSSYFL